MPDTPRSWSTLLHPTRSLRARLGLVFGGLTMTLSVLLAFTLGSSARRNAEHTTAQTLSTASSHMAYLLGHWLAERYDDIHVLAQLPRVRDGDDAANLRRTLDEYRQDYPGYLWLGLLTRDGRVLAGTGPVPSRPSAFPATQPYIGPVRPLPAAAANTGATTQTSSPPRRVLDLVVPVTDTTGHTWGILWALLDWRWAEDVRASLEATLPPTQQENVVVARPDGTVLLGPPSVARHLPPPVIQTRDPGVAEVETWPDGRSYLTAVIPGTRQRNTPDFPYVVIARQPTDLAFARARQLERTMVAGGVGAGLAFALLGWWLASRIARPLTAIADAAEHMRAGDPSVRIPPARSRDEIGTLADSLRNLLAELRAAQSQLAAARDDAEAASRAKDRFLAVLSHELRTPLTPILIALADLDTDGFPPDLRHDLDMIRRNVDLEARLIDDLLDTTRIASGKLRLNRQPTDVHEVLRYAVDTCLPDAQAKGVAIAVHADAPEHRASADPARLEQVFWNLLKNAIKFTPPGGTITVRTRNLRPTSLAPGREPDSASPGGRAATDSLVVDVTDTGIGIPPANLRHIFRPFEQGDPGITRQFGGLGLGLAISKSLAESHGGSLTASSPGPHLGSTFTVTLPLLPTPAEAERDKADRRSAAPDSSSSIPQSLHILLVEDHPDTARLLARILRTRGHTVTTAGSVSEALAAADHAAFDLVISDLGLPDGSGADVMRRLRSSQPHPPRGIAVSGYGTDADKQLTRDAGFDAHLTKPIKLADLEPLLRAAAPAPGAAAHEPPPSPPRDH